MESLQLYNTREFGEIQNTSLVLKIDKAMKMRMQIDLKPKKELTSASKEPISSASKMLNNDHPEADSYKEKKLVVDILFSIRF
jgi:hypothetical protein